MDSRSIVLCVGFALICAGCGHYERQETSETRSVEIGAAKEARIDVEMGAGELRVDAGSPQLLDADFHYSVAQWRPELKYDVSGGRGFVSVKQPPIRGFGGDNTQNRWDLHLNDRVPLELRVHLGAGEGHMKLSGMVLRRLEVSIGAGEVELDLRGHWDEKMEATIRGGVGEATVRLPRDAGVRVRATGGIGGVSVDGLREEGGFYYNEAYRKQGVQLRIDVSGGIGQINLIG